MQGKNSPNPDLVGPMAKLYRQNLRKVNEMKVLSNLPNMDQINSNLIKKLFTGGKTPFDKLYDKIKAEIEDEEEEPAGNYELESSRAEPKRHKTAKVTISEPSQSDTSLFKIPSFEITREKEVSEEMEFSKKNQGHLKKIGFSIKGIDDSLKKYNHFLDDEELMFPEHPLNSDQSLRMFPNVKEKVEVSEPKLWKKHGSLSPREVSQKKLVSKENQIKVLHYYNILQQECEEDPEITRKKSIICMKMLSIIASELTIYQEPLQLLAGVIEKYLVCSSSWVLGKMRSISKTFYLDKKKTYLEVIKYLFELIERERMENKETTENLNTKISGLKAELKAGQSEVNEFKERLKKLEEEYQRQIQVKTKDLTDKIYQSQLENSHILKEMNSLKIQLKDEKEKANMKLQNTILQNERQVSEITAKRKEAEQKYHEIFEKYKNLIESQATLIENHKTSVLSLKIARERIEEMENKMRKLDSEMYVLGKRAAVQFEELTPRPNFKQVCQDFDLDEGVLEGRTTKDKVVMIIKGLRENALTMSTGEKRSFLIPMKEDRNVKKLMAAVLSKKDQRPGGTRANSPSEKMDKKAREGTPEEKKV